VARGSLSLPVDEGANVARVSRGTLGLALAVVLAACRGETPAPAEIPTRTPPALRASLLAARQQRGGDAYRFDRAPSGRAAGRNEAQRIEVALAEGALEVTGVGDDGAPAVTRVGVPWRAGLRWTALGRGSNLAPVARPDGEAERVANRASYRRAADGSEEQYVNGPLGVEQTFVLTTPPEGRGGEALTVEVSASGDLAPVLMEGGAGVALRDAHGATVARYTDLSAFDADGWSGARGSRSRAAPSGCGSTTRGRGTRCASIRSCGPRTSSSS
jgi:hypothetical protein